MDVFCFDFDGVICDSAPETAVTAWLGCRELWPQHGGAADAPATLPTALQERFCRLRPVMHTGFEAIPLMRLIETGEADDDALFADFPALRDRLMAREGLAHERLQHLFGAIRDRLIAEDEAAWLRWNRFYPGVGPLLAAAIARTPLYIVTTKQERFAALLLRNEGIALPPGRIFGLEAKRSKPEILAALLGRPEHAGATFHFIEDRADTLHDVIARDALRAVRLYLVDWGYNTPAQRREAAATGRIRVVSLREFAGVLGG